MSFRGRRQGQGEAWVTRASVVEPISTRHFPAADGVRGLAILAVLFHHSAWIEQPGSSLVLKLTRATAATGWTGVELFFVLSGFLITGILVDALGSPRYFRNFYIRRTLRIFPLYYAVLILGLFVVPYLANVPEWTALAQKNQCWYWTYASNWGDTLGHTITVFLHFWSLAVEEQFYLCWPLLVFALSRRQMIGLCAIMLLTTPLIRFLLELPWFPPEAGYSWTIARWDALAAGALLALLLREEPGRSWFARNIGRVTTVSAVALGLLTVYERGFHESNLSVRIVGQSLIALLSVSLIYYCVAPSGPRASAVQRVMSAGWLRFFGKYSYAIYVFHWPIQFMLTPYAADALNTGDTATRFLKLATYLACVLGLSTLAAMVSWRVLEKPCLELKDRLAPRREVGSPQELLSRAREKRAEIARSPYSTASN
jgi:peptidoglycan/LPS O-acetylase OafA/YrhL